MTYEEAMKHTQIFLKVYDLFSGDQLAIETLMEATEKQIPKKPYKVSFSDYECPKCHKFLHLRGYPCRCGQMISWDDEDV